MLADQALAFWQCACTIREQEATHERLVAVTTFEHASAVVRRYIDANGLGVGNTWGVCGRIYDGDTVVANVAYNGRVFRGDVGDRGEEIRLRD